jgi:hypothetical protein
MVDTAQLLSDELRKTGHYNENLGLKLVPLLLLLLNIADVIMKIYA